MSYTINNYNGTILANVPDGTLDTTTSLKFAGRNYAGYGEALNENQLWLMQHFANASAPANPVIGQVWYNTTLNVLNSYNGTDWKAIATADQLYGTNEVVYEAIAANIGLVNANIISNVASMTANAASQQDQIDNLWANAAIQDSSIVSLWANAVSQTAQIAQVNANVAGANAVIATLATSNSPALTGNPTAPTASLGNRSTSIATTEYVMTQDDLRRSYVDTVITSNVAALTSAYQSADALKAPIDSPNFTGSPSTQTPVIGDNSTRLATTAYVMSQDTIRRVYVDTNISANIAALNNAVSNNLTLKAPIANPSFTGSANAPTPTPGDSSTQIATTAFVQETVASDKSTWQGSRRFISTGAPNPSLGNDGDFWFQYQ
jgi:hypothetical protein